MTIKLAVMLSLKDLLGAMDQLKDALEDKAAEFFDVLKMGRTANQDAVPMPLGQKFSAYAVMIDSAMATLERAGDEFHDINMGATAIVVGMLLFCENRKARPPFFGCYMRNIFLFTLKCFL